MFLNCPHPIKEYKGRQCAKHLSCQALGGFDDEPELCGEKTLEAIHAAWIEELE